MTQHNLYLVKGRDGQQVAVGQRQAEWLMGDGHVTLERSEQTSPASGVNFYSAGDRTAQEINELVCSNRELAECDFCPPPVQATHTLNVRPGLQVDMRELGRPALNRRVFLCSSCAELVRTNQKVVLIADVVEKWVARSLEEHNVLPHQARAVAGPYYGGFIRAVFANRQGPPEELS